MLIGAIYKSVILSLKAPDFSLFSMEEELQYNATFDSDGRALDGSRNYKIHLPPNIPASNFWSVIVYDNETSLLICTDQPWPSVFSSCKSLFVNPDGSVDAWFGPKPPAGGAHNWVKTIPGRGWNMILRLYYPTESWFNKTWRPGKVEEVK
jgi:hypothetical protein